MPLKPGRSKSQVSENIREFHKGPTYSRTAAKFGQDRANKQAVAVALSEARESRPAPDQPHQKPRKPRGSVSRVRR